MYSEKCFYVSSRMRNGNGKILNRKEFEEHTYLLFVFEIENYGTLYVIPSTKNTTQKCFGVQLLPLNEQ